MRCEYRRAICRIGVQNIAKRERKAAPGVAQRRKIKNNRVSRPHNGHKKARTCVECGFGGAVVAYKKKAALPDGVFTGGHNARMREIEGRFANASGAVCGLR